MFRPATHRRELLAGQTVTLSAACQHCGETLTTEWALPGAEGLAWESSMEQAPPMEHARERELPMAAGAEGWRGAGATSRPSFQQGHAASSLGGREERRSAPRTLTSVPTDGPRASSHAPARTDDPALGNYISSFSNRVETARESLRRVSEDLTSALEVDGGDRFRSPRLSPRAGSGPVAAVAPPAAPVSPEPAALEPAPMPPMAPQIVAPEEPMLAPAPEPAPEPAPVVTYQEPIAEIAPTDDDVFPAAPAAAVAVVEETAAPAPAVEMPEPVEAITAAAEPELPAAEDAMPVTADVWGAAPATGADGAMAAIQAPDAGFHTAFDEATAELGGAALTGDAADAVDVSVVADPDRGFDWDEQEQDTRPRKRRARRERSGARRTKGRAAKEISVTSIPSGAMPQLATAADADAGSVAPKRSRSRIGLVGIIFIAVLAVTCGITVLKLVQAPSAESVATEVSPLTAPQIEPALEAGAADDAPAADADTPPADAPAVEPPGEVAGAGADANGFADAAAAAADGGDASASTPSDAQELDAAADTPDVAVAT